MKNQKLNGGGGSTKNEGGKGLIGKPSSSDPEGEKKKKGVQKGGWGVGGGVKKGGAGWGGE